jgi:dimethylhistidine N-methyltransferase
MAVQRDSALPGCLTPPPRPADPFLADVLAGLRKPQKELPCKYFYDAAGSALFDRICELPEYYPTRTETAILRAHAPAMGERLGSGCQVVEYGSGSGTKTPLLLAALPRPAAYVPVDISGDHLLRSAAAIARAFPDLPVTPVAADFTRPFTVPPLRPPLARRVAFFPGSTIGNFAPAEAVALLRQMARLVGPGGSLLIGADLTRDERTLLAAYDDPAGVTAAFNRNLLVRANRELGADFDLAAFRHRAVYDPGRGRVEMHLVSTREQTVRVAGTRFHFEAGEHIHTENSHKYTEAGFRELAGRAGFCPVQAWADDRRRFGVLLFAVAAGERRG